MKLLISINFVLLALLFFGCCAGSRCQTDMLGVWGGDHIGMVVSDSSTIIDYDCAHGTIDEPFVISNGEFELVGTHVFEHGGPIRIDEIPEEHPALYKGTIEGNIMTLKVIVKDTGEEFGTFTLTLGKTPNVYKCL